MATSMCWSPGWAPAAPSPAFPALSSRTGGKRLLSVAVEPKESPVITQHLAGSPLMPGMHGIEGIGAGFIPNTLDLSLLDRVELVDSAEAMEFSTPSRP